MTIDIDAIREKWATVCGPCDGGLPQGCTCPTGDPRVPISALLTEVGEVTAERDFSTDLLDGTAKTLGLDLDNYHVHSEIPAKVAELVAELEQFRESARYYSAQVADLADKLHKAETQVHSLEKATTAYANEVAAKDKVVEAAKQWGEHYSNTSEAYHNAATALIAALKTLPNEQEPCDICSGYGCPDCRDDLAGVSL